MLKSFDIGKEWERKVPKQYFLNCTLETRNFLRLLVKTLSVKDTTNDSGRI